MALYLTNKCRFENSFRRLTKGLELFLTEVIHYNQNGFVKWRSVFDAVWTIGDSLGMKIALGSWLLSNLKKQMILLPMIFYLKFRRKLNFGSYFKQWIRTFYTDISSYVMNNGFSYKLSFVQSIGFFKVILSYLSFLLWTWKFLRVKLDRITIWKE